MHKNLIFLLTALSLSSVAYSSTPAAGAALAQPEDKVRKALRDELDHDVGSLIIHGIVPEDTNPEVAQQLQALAKDHKNVSTEKERELIKLRIKRCLIQHTRQIAHEAHKRLDRVNNEIASSIGKHPNNVAKKTRSKSVADVLEDLNKLTNRLINGQQCITFSPDKMFAHRLQQRIKDYHAAPSEEERSDIKLDIASMNATALQLCLKETVKIIAELDQEIREEADAKGAYGTLGYARHYLYNDKRKYVAIPLLAAGAIGLGYYLYQKYYAAEPEENQDA